MCIRDRFFFDAAKAEPAEDWKKGSVCVDDDGNVYVGDVYKRQRR